MLGKSDRLSDLRVGLHGNLSRNATRTNRQMVKDGSELMDQVAHPQEFFPILTVTQNHNLALPEDSNFHIMTSNAVRNITGIAGGGSNDPGTGREIRLMNSNFFTTFRIQLLNESLGSLAENRMILPWGLTWKIFHGHTVTLFYDGAVSRWRFVR